MAGEFELIGPNDKPALIAMGAPDAMEFVKGTLVNLGYKVHAAETHEDFMQRFAQIPYEVIVLDETFCGATLAEHASLSWLQKLPMARRRHATIFLVGMSFQTMHTMQAFQQSVHAVVNPNEYNNLPQVLQKGIADNAMFMNTFKEVQKQLSAGKS